MDLSGSLPDPPHARLLTLHDSSDGKIGKIISRTLIVRIEISSRPVNVTLKGDYP